jgi:1-acyl-sn-glycerol-3-phosphate acyltransferase
MQEIVFEDPYEFIPPYRGKWWSWLIQHAGLFEIWLRRAEGVIGADVQNIDRLKRSVDDGHGVIIAPNHCRTADPVAMGYLARAAGIHVYSMAGWHLFKQSKWIGWAINRLGAFSIYREGVDRQSINMAIEILRTAERPLVLFPEGSVTRTNDQLHALLDGVLFIARTAAKRRARDVPGGKVVIHPVGIKYLFGGDLRKAIDPVLTTIEHRFSWRPQSDRPLIERITRVGTAILCLKELEYFGSPQSGELSERLSALIDRLLCPLEAEWLGEASSGSVVPRVKQLRFKILPDMVQKRVDEDERQRRWRQLADIYLAQQVSCYLPEYLAGEPSVDRLLETVERFEEDLTDTVTVHGSLKAIIRVGEAMEVSTKRDRKAEVDPMMVELETRLQGLLDELAPLSRKYRE